MWLISPHNQENHLVKENPKTKQEEEIKRWYLLP